MAYTTSKHCQQTLCIILQWYAALWKSTLHQPLYFPSVIKQRKSLCSEVATAELTIYSMRIPAAIIVNYMWIPGIWSMESDSMYSLAIWHWHAVHQKTIPGHVTRHLAAQRVSSPLPHAPHTPLIGWWPKQSQSGLFHSRAVLAKKLLQRDVRNQRSCFLIWCWLAAGILHLL